MSEWKLLFFQTEFTFLFGKKMHRKCLWPAIEPLQPPQQQFVRCYQITMCKFPARRSDTDSGFVPDGKMYENVNDAAHGWSIFQGHEHVVFLVLHKQMQFLCVINQPCSDLHPIFESLLLLFYFIFFFLLLLNTCCLAALLTLYFEVEVEENFEQWMMMMMMIKNSSTSF